MTLCVAANWVARTPQAGICEDWCGSILMARLALLSQEMVRKRTLQQDLESGKREPPSQQKSKSESSVEASIATVREGKGTEPP